MLRSLLQDFRNRNDPDAAWIARRGVEDLVKLFRTIDFHVVPDGRRLSVAGKQIELNVRVEQKLQQRGEHFIAAAFRIAIDGVAVPAFVAAAIGVDATTEGARELSTFTWFAQYGSPIGYAIANWLDPKLRDGLDHSIPTVDVDGEMLFHGTIVIRSDCGYGDATTDEFLRSLGGRAIPLLGDRSRFRSATIKVFVEAGAVKDGECRVNGSVSPALLNELRKMKWPKGPAPFLYTLFFVTPPAL